MSNSSSNLKENYLALISAGKLKEDLAQEVAINALSALLTHFLDVHSNRAVQGIYLHGQVGRGKTMLMDLFFEAIPIKRKQRIHFHRFMESVHYQLNTTSGIENPLRHIAKAWANNIDVLCFDEFYVSDIADAILLSGLLHGFIENDVVIVATSNCHPQMLYKGGLQRERFIPAIELIEAKMTVISVDGDVDHRVDNSAFLSSMPFYLNLNDRASIKANDKAPEVIDHEHGQAWMLSHFKKLAHALPSHGHLIVNNRQVDFLGRTKDIIWFDFSMICDGPRSQLDYISLANDFRTILVSNVPQFAGENIQHVAQGTEEDYQRSSLGLEKMQTTDDIARRFIALVDELYDRHVRLILTAECDVAELYLGKQLRFEFKRCHSRLVEMQTF